MCTVSEYNSARSKVRTSLASFVPTRTEDEVKIRVEGRENRNSIKRLAIGTAEVKGQFRDKVSDGDRCMSREISCRAGFNVCSGG